VKEKRIDMWLSVATMGQLMLIGAGGTYAVEFFLDKPRAGVLYAALTFSIVLIIALTMLYWFIYRKTKNRKWKH
jgi:hypothetical protein